jgi:hemolysin III
MINNQSLQSKADWYNQRLQDGGPIYTETDLNQFIVEPWNAISSLLIVIPAIYWLWRVRNEYKNYWFLICCAPLMILGGTGSTLFHAFRESRFFLIMDVLPTALLTLSITIYFWIKLLKKWGYVFLIIIPSMLVRYWIFTSEKLSEFMVINLSYIITGTLIGLPLLLILIKMKFYKFRQVVLAISFFILAIVFRGMDSKEIEFLPMGTHFLWHAFTGFGAYFILSFLYYFQKSDFSRSSITQ